MKACPQYAEDLAACAATSQAPDQSLAAHLRSCALCRDTLTELRRVVVVNNRVAAGLAEPLKPISLPSVFLKTLGRREQSRGLRFLRPVLWVAAMTACIAMFLAMWGSQRKPDRTISFVQPRREEASWEPTWQRLREGVDTLPANRGGGSVVAHYRIKDAYSDLN